MVGGSTRIPAVQRLVKGVCGVDSYSTSRRGTGSGSGATINPDEAVSVDCYPLLACLTLTNHKPAYAVRLGESWLSWARPLSYLRPDRIQAKFVHTVLLTSPPCPTLPHSASTLTYPYLIIPYTILP